MFQSETLARAVHADRVREIERSVRNHRLLQPAVETEARPVLDPCGPQVAPVGVPAAARRGRTGAAA